MSARARRACRQPSVWMQLKRGVCVEFSVCVIEKWLRSWRPYPLGCHSRTALERSSFPTGRRKAHRSTRPPETTGSCSRRRWTPDKLPTPPQMNNHAQLHNQLRQPLPLARRTGGGPGRRDLSRLRCCRSVGDENGSSSRNCNRRHGRWERWRAGNCTICTRRVELIAKQTVFGARLSWILTKTLQERFDLRRRGSANLRHRHQRAQSNRKAPVRMVWHWSAGRWIHRPMAVRSSTTWKTISYRSALSSAWITKSPSLTIR